KRHPMAPLLLDRLRKTFRRERHTSVHNFLDRFREREYLAQLHQLSSARSCQIKALDEMIIWLFMLNGQDETTKASGGKIVGLCFMCRRRAVGSKRFRSRL